MSRIQEKIKKAASSTVSGVFNLVVMNNEKTEGVFLSKFILALFLVIIIPIGFESIRNRNISLSEEYNSLKVLRDQTHNHEMSISKEYIIKMGEEYILEEARRREIPIYENMKLSKKISEDE